MRQLPLRTASLLALVALALLLLPDLRDLVAGALLAAVLIGGNLYSFKQSEKRLAEALALVEDARRKATRWL